MRSSTVYERNGWKVVSYGNGFAYTLHYGAKSCCFQGDDAEAFRAATLDGDGFFSDTCEERFSDYSEIMTPDHA